MSTNATTQADRNAQHRERFLQQEKTVTGLRNIGATDAANWLASQSLANPLPWERPGAKEMHDKVHEAKAIQAFEKVGGSPVFDLPTQKAPAPTFAERHEHNMKAAKDAAAEKALNSVAKETTAAKVSKSIKKKTPIAVTKAIAAKPAKVAAKPAPAAKKAIPAPKTKVASTKAKVAEAKKPTFKPGVDVPQAAKATLLPTSKPATPVAIAPKKAAPAPAKKVQAEKAKVATPAKPKAPAVAPKVDKKASAPKQAPAKKKETPAKGK